MLPFVHLASAVADAKFRACKQEATNYFEAANPRCFTPAAIGADCCLLPTVESLRLFGGSNVLIPGRSQC